MNYESPIEILTSQIRFEYENNIMTAIQDYGVNVDKEELIKALKYDRDQYMKGYQDGLIDGGYHYKQLYLVENSGCNVTTYGLVWVRDSEFPRFREFIENLNKNSHYGCMPTIAVYKADMSEFKEIVYDPSKDCWDEDYVDKDYLLYLDGKTYTFVEEYGHFNKREVVIEGGREDD